MTEVRSATLSIARESHPPATPRGAPARAHRLRGGFVI
jgi:hypothetical protein